MKVISLHICPSSACLFPRSTAEQDWKKPAGLACLQGSGLKNNQNLLKTNQTTIPFPWDSCHAPNTWRGTGACIHNKPIQTTTTQIKKGVLETAASPKGWITNYMKRKTSNPCSCQDKQVLPRHWGIFTLPALCLYRSIQIVTWASWRLGVPGHSLTHRPGLSSMYRTDQKGYHTENSLSSLKQVTNI